jgi:hypothetical protein
MGEWLGGARLPNVADLSTKPPTLFDRCASRANHRAEPGAGQRSLESYQRERDDTNGSAD